MFLIFFFFSPNEIDKSVVILRIEDHLEFFDMLTPHHPPSSGTAEFQFLVFCLFTPNVCLPEVSADISAFVILNFLIFPE